MISQILSKRNFCHSNHHFIPSRFAGLTLTMRFLFVFRIRDGGFWPKRPRGKAGSCKSICSYVTGGNMKIVGCTMYGHLKRTIQNPKLRTQMIFLLALSITCLVRSFFGKDSPWHFLYFLLLGFNHQEVVSMSSSHLRSSGGRGFVKAGGKGRLFVKCETSSPLGRSEGQQ